MVSPELLRRYPFFAGLNHDQLRVLAMTADEMDAKAGHRFFVEGARVDAFYFVIEGDVGIVFKVPASGVKQSVARQLTGELEMAEVIISHVGPGEQFGWSALTGDGDATADAVAQTDCKVVVFDLEQMLSKLDADPVLARMILQQVLRTVRQRLNDLRVECLSAR